MLNFGVSEKKMAELRERMARCGLLESDLEERFVRAQGPGGQKTNKTSTCVHLQHKPSGLEVKTQRERSQGMNRFFARRRLCELLEAEQLGTASPEALRHEKVRRQKQRRKRRRRGKDAPPPAPFQRDETS